MKKTTALLSALFISVCFSVSLSFGLSYTAHADGEFLRVITENTPLYEDKVKSKLLFYLPYTYYVKVLSVEGDVAHIEYAGEFAPAIDGYADYSALFSDGLTVENPYPALTLKTCKTATFYSDLNLTESTRYIFPERTLYYYGFIRLKDAYIYCVSYGGGLGYVKEDCLYPFTLNDHPNELTFLKAEETSKEIPEEEKESANDNSFILRIIVIGCLILAGLIAAFAVKKPKKPDALSYYDENDFG